MPATGARAPRAYARALLVDPACAPGASDDIRKAIASALRGQCAPWFLEFEQVRERVYDFCFRSAGY
eukprot:7189614-Lingulodinium_polyedra.AAC.1